jgi:translation initiation factor 2B subunit (eIF-2B alpha/beta/delta family)
MTETDLTSWSAQLRSAGEDRLSGASTVALRAAEGFAALAEQAEATDHAALLAQVVAAARELLARQPSMAPLFNLVNAVVRAAKDVDELEAARASVAIAARGFLAAQSERRQAAARLGGAMVRTGNIVLVHSYSMMVAAALVRAHDAGRTPRVICTESRPGGEGRALARHLNGVGIPTTLALDAAAASLTGEIDLVLLGADALTQAGLVNKIGSCGIAWAAAASNVPCYVVASTEKIWPAALNPLPHIADQDPNEVWSDAPKGVRVLNRYFDLTPWSALSGVITERGLVSADGITRLIANVDVSPELFDLAP